MKYAVLVISVLLLVNVTFLFFVSNFTFGMVLQGLVSAMAVLYAFCFGKIPRAGHAIAGAACAALLIFAASLAVYGKFDNAEYNEDVVIVLGAAVRGEQVGRTLAKRLDKAVEYYGRNPGAVFAVCGGQGFQEDITEALAMERYLTARGIPREKIIKEEKSTSTYENLSFARDVLEPYFPRGFSGVLITSDFHVYRASRLARYAGIPVKHIGAPTEWYTAPVNYLREMPAVVKTLFVTCNDGFTYTGRTVKIGSLTWMAENLNSKAGKSWCYDDKASNCEKYGRLYDWNTAAKACPSGWRLPVNEEWEDLVTIAGGSGIAGKKLKTSSGWNDKVNLQAQLTGSGGNGTDDFMFSAMPGGFRHQTGMFYAVGDDGYWWSGTKFGGDKASHWSINYAGDNMKGGFGGLQHSSKSIGFSVRCVRGD